MIYLKADFLLIVKLRKIQTNNFGNIICMSLRSCTILPFKDSNLKDNSICGEESGGGWQLHLLFAWH